MFQYDNPFVAFFRKVFELLVAGFYWIVASLPIITVGAASAALYRTTLKVIKKNDGKITSEFFGFFKENFKSSCPLTVIQFLLILLLGLFFFGCSLLESGSLVRRAYWALGLVLAILLTAVSMYLYPLFSRFTYATPWQYFKMSLYLTIRHFKYTFCLVLCPAVVSLITLLNPVCLLLYPSVVAYAASNFLEPVFREYMEEPKEGEPVPWYWT